MRPFIGGLFLFLAVQVSHAYIDEPRGCWQSLKLPCAMSSSKAGELFSWNSKEQSAEWTAGNKSSWIVEQQGLKLLSGRLWLKKSEQFSLRTSQLSLKVSGELWVDCQDSKTFVFNLNSESMQLELRGTEKTLGIPLGFQNWFGDLNSLGSVSQGVLRPIDKSAFFKSWAKHMKVNRLLASEKVEEWKELWKNSAQMGSNLYSEIAQRMIAKEDQKRSEAQRRRADQIQEQSRLRKMFRERNGLIN